MPYRLFEDSRGAEWQVWDIVPRNAERRTTDDRRAGTQVIEFADRRRTDERRIANRPRSSLSGSYAHGWLAFDNGREKRRLTPIPADWTTCAPEQLESYAKQAQVVAGSQRRAPAPRDDDRMAEAG